MDIVDSLEQTFDHAHHVIAAVRPDQFDEATPCPDWTVRDLLTHTIGVVAAISAAASGQPPVPFELGPEPAAQFASLSAAALGTWRTPGVLDSVVTGRAGTMPGRSWVAINVLDTATHAWDLAVATGQPAELPPAVASAALAASREVVDENLRLGRFGPPVVVPDGATDTEALVAFLGRTP